MHLFTTYALLAVRSRETTGLLDIMLASDGNNTELIHENSIRDFLIYNGRQKWSISLKAKKY